MQKIMARKTNSKVTVPSYKFEFRASLRVKLSPPVGMPVGRLPLGGPFPVG